MLNSTENYIDSLCNPIPTKTTIGKFYLLIDMQLQARGSSPYNTYKFIECVINSDVPDSSIMTYGADQTVGVLQAEVRLCSKLVPELTDKVMKQQAELKEIRQYFENIREPDKMKSNKVLNPRLITPKTRHEVYDNAACHSRHN